MGMKSEPILTTNQVNNRLLETLRLFLEHYRDMDVWQREIIFEAIREIIVKPAPIEKEFYHNESSVNEIK